MRTHAFTAGAVAASFGVVSVASGDGTFDPSLDVAVGLGDFTLTADAGGNPPTVDFNVTGPGGVVGMSFAGDASGLTGNGTWASDTRLSILVDGVEVFNIGGLTGRDNDWDFQGSSSTSDGFYTSGPHIFAKDNPIAGGADWTFVFFHNWNSGFAAPITWSEAGIILHRVPSPGVLGVAGLGGLLAARRRR